MKRILSFFTKQTQKKNIIPCILVSKTEVKMGTFVNLQCLAESEDLALMVLEKAFVLIDNLELLFSRHDSSSLLSVLNAQGKIQDFPQEFSFVLEQANKVEEKTFGAFNASVLPVLEYLETHKKISKKDLVQCFQYIQEKSIQLSEKNICLANSDTKITLDAIAKGFIVDAVGELFEQHGIINYLINAGGDIRIRGMKSLEKGQEKSWRVAIEDPYKKGNYPAVFTLMRGALATSGNYEKNFGKNYHHIILPHLSQDNNEKKISLTSLEENVSPLVKSVSVLANTAMEADAYATAISCMPIETALSYVEQVNLSCFIIDEEDKVHTSKNWIVR